MKLRDTWLLFFLLLLLGGIMALLEWVRDLVFRAIANIKQRLRRSVYRLKQH